MHWGEDDEDSSEEEDQSSTTEESTSTSTLTPATNISSSKSSISSSVSGEEKDNNEADNNKSSSSTSINAATTSPPTSTPQTRKPRTASVEDFYQSLNPTQSEISSYVDKHGPFAGTMMATAKPLSRALRAKLSELLVEQEQLLERIRTQRKNTKELPEMDHIVAVLNKVPEYQKKMQWIKGSMQRTQSMVDQMKKQSLSLQAQVQRDVIKTAEKKKVEQQQYAQTKAKVVSSGSKGEDEL